MLITVTKVEAATAMFKRALDAYLDDADYISAVVLAGSAEDILHGVLGRSGRGGDASRAQMVGVAQSVAQHLDPTSSPLTSADAIALLRGPFNWLRHNDKPAEPEQVTWDFEKEAALIIFRALENFDALALALPQRTRDFLEKELREPDSPSTITPP